MAVVDASLEPLTLAPVGALSAQILTDNTPRQREERQSVCVCVCGGEGEREGLIDWAALECSEATHRSIL